jgi:hypothetical protein
MAAKSKVSAGEAGKVAILKLYVPEADRETVRKFKVLCAGRQTSVSAALLDYMRKQTAKLDLGDLEH